MRLDEVAGNPRALECLRAITPANWPHLLLFGPPGTGKTTSLHCLARQHLAPPPPPPPAPAAPAKAEAPAPAAQAEPPPPLSREWVLELNASDERGLDVVRGKILAFAQSRPAAKGDSGGAEAKGACRKLVILDEADSMTAKAQLALKGLMDQHEGPVRFALACNALSKIIEPLQSRCLMLAFDPLPALELRKRVFDIAALEGIPAGKITDGGAAALVYAANGDLRAAINVLQAVWRGCGLVGRDQVLAIADVPPPDELAGLLRVILRPPGHPVPPKRARNAAVRQGCTTISSLLARGYSAVDIFSHLLTLASAPRFAQLLQGAAPAGPPDGPDAPDPPRALAPSGAATHSDVAACLPVVADPERAAWRQLQVVELVRQYQRRIVTLGLSPALQLHALVASCVALPDDSDPRK
jgi:DNA polymerase III delta prime subunit